MFYLLQVEKCDAEAEKILQQFHNETGMDFKDENPVKPIRHNKPKIENLHLLLLSIHGANPTILPGITDYSFMRLTAELGNDIKQWPTIKCFTSWLGLAPGKNESGKRTKRNKKRSTTRAGQIFKQAAQSILISKQPGLGSFARKLKAKRGAAIAIKATARKLAELYYKIFSEGMQYVEEGVKLYEEKLRLQQIRYLQKKATELNFQLVEN